MDVDSYTLRDEIDMCWAMIATAQATVYESHRLIADNQRLMEQAQQLAAHREVFEAEWRERLNALPRAALLRVLTSDPRA